MEVEISTADLLQGVDDFLNYFSFTDWMIDRERCLWHEQFGNVKMNVAIIRGSATPVLPVALVGEWLLMSCVTSVSTE